MHALHKTTRIVSSAVWRVWLAIALLMWAGLVAGCSVTPATGQSQLNVMSPGQEIRLGEQAMPQFIEANGGEVPDAQVRAYVTRIGKRLADVSERPDLPWEFVVLDSAQINAFALPGGKVFISRGLMEKMDNEAQLAGVLGHEVGHVTAKHINDRMAQAYIIGGAALILGAVGEANDDDLLKTIGIGVGVGGAVYQLSFSRGQEVQSDALGVRYMTRLGYNPVGQMQVMQVLKQASGGGGSGLQEFLSTHPLPQTRIDRLQTLIQREHPDYATAGAYAFGHDAYKAAVLDRFENLPPPKHNPTSVAAGSQVHHHSCSASCWSAPALVASNQPSGP